MFACRCRRSSKANLGWHYLSSTTCLIRLIEFATLFATFEKQVVVCFMCCCFCSFRDHHNLLHSSPLLKKKTCVRRVVLDEWFPLNIKARLALLCWLKEVFAPPNNLQYFYMLPLIPCAATSAAATARLRADRRTPRSGHHIYIYIYIYI